MGSTNEAILGVDPAVLHWVWTAPAFSTLALFCLLGLPSAGLLLLATVLFTSAATAGLSLMM